jgi:hypothetical protein
MTILIPQQQLSSQERQLPQRKLDKCKKDTLYMGNLRQIGQIQAPDLPRRGINNKTNKKELASKTKKYKAVVTQMPRVTRNDCQTSCYPSHLAEPVTPSLVTTEQAQATTTKTTILIVLT